MRKYKVENIQWDCDGDEEVLASLPKEMEVNVDESLDSDEVMDFISNKISDETGYCHNGFNYHKEETALTKDEIISALSKMNVEDILFVYAHSKDGEQLAMGTEKHQVLDGVIVFLCNAVGSNCDYKFIPFDADDTPENEVYGKVADFFFETADNLLGKGNVHHLSLG